MGHGSGLLEGDRGHRLEPALGGAHVVGERPEAVGEQVRPDPVADAEPGCAGADGLDDTGHVDARDAVSRGKEADERRGTIKGRPRR